MFVFKYRKSALTPAQGSPGATETGTVQVANCWRRHLFRGDCGLRLSFLSAVISQKLCTKLCDAMGNDNQCFFVWTKLYPEKKPFHLGSGLTVWEKFHKLSAGTWP